MFDGGDAIYVRRMRSVKKYYNAVSALLMVCRWCFLVCAQWCIGWGWGLFFVPFAWMSPMAILQFDPPNIYSRAVQCVALMRIILQMWWLDVL